MMRPRGHRRHASVLATWCNDYDSSDAVPIWYRRPATKTEKGLMGFNSLTLNLTTVIGADSRTLCVIKGGRGQPGSRRCRVTLDSFGHLVRVPRQMNNAERTRGNKWACYFLPKGKSGSLARDKLLLCCVCVCVYVCVLLWIHLLNLCVFFSISLSP